MSENTKWPTIDELPRTKSGLIIAPRLYPDWYEVEQHNLQRGEELFTSLFENKANMDVEESYPIVFYDEYESTSDSVLNEYSISQFHRVHLSISVKRKDEGAISTSYVGELPKGFRPHTTAITACYGQTERGEIVLGGLQISASGQIYLSIVAAIHVVGQITFVAAQ